MARGARGLCLALCLLLCVLGCLAAPFSSRISDSSLMSLFTFTEGQTSTSAGFAVDQVPAAPLGRIKTNVPPSSWDSNKVGISFPLTSTANVHRGISERNASALLDRISKSQAFTFELWFEPSYFTINSKVMEAEIVGFGDIAVGEPWVKSCIDYGTDVRRIGGLRVIQSSFGLQVQLVTRAPDGTPDCAPLSALTTLAPTHLAVVFNRSEPIETAVLYVNNVKSSSVGGTSTPYVPFFTNDNNTATVFHLSPKWTSTTTATDFWVGSVYLTSVYDRALTPAEISTNYNAWLANSLPIPTSSTVQVFQNTFTSFRMNCSDFDVTSSRAPASSLITTVMSLPSSGQLFYFNTTLSQFIPITSPGWTISDPSATVGYSPATNVLSTMSFLFKCYDGYADSRTNGTITLSVTRVNQAPVATNNTQSGYSGSYTAITMTGTDFESDPLRAAFILSLPTNGTLFQTNSSLVPLWPITTIPAAVFDSQLRVLFFQNLLPTGSGQDVLYNTSFLFLVQDLPGRNSTYPGVQTVSVRNNLQISSADVFVTGDTNKTITLSYTDKAQLGQSVEFVMLSAPSNGGSIFINGTNGTRVTSFPAVIPGGTFFYVPVLYFSGIETSSYLVRYPSSAAISPNFTSPIAPLTFTVTPVAHAPVLKLSFPVAPIQASANVPYNFVVSLTSVDAERVTLVSIETTGFGCNVAVTNDTIISRLRFFIGTGKASPALTFQGARSDVALALKNLQVISYVSGSRAIQITVTELGGTLSAEIQIGVDTTEDTSTTSGSSNSFVGTYMIVGWAVFAGLCCCCCCCYCMRKYHDFKERKHEAQLAAAREEALAHMHAHPHICAHCAVRTWKRVASHRIEVRTGKSPPWSPRDSTEPIEERLIEDDVVPEGTTPQPTVVLESTGLERGVTGESVASAAPSLTSQSSARRLLSGDSS